MTERMKGTERGKEEKGKRGKEKWVNGKGDEKGEGDELIAKDTFFINIV